MAGNHPRVWLSLDVVIVQPSHALAGYPRTERDIIQPSMNLETLVQTALDLIASHPYTTGAILAVVGVAAWFKLKLVVKAISACLILGVMAYVVMFLFNLTSTGMQNTEKFRGNPGQTVDRLRQ